VVSDDPSPAVHGRSHTPLVLDGVRVDVIRATMANGMTVAFADPSREQWDALMKLGFEVTKGVQDAGDGV
jgi:hypothetical protein